MRGVDGHHKMNQKYNFDDKRDEIGAQKLTQKFIVLHFFPPFGSKRVHRTPLIPPTHHDPAIMIFAA